MNKKPFSNLPFLTREKKPREVGINYVRAPVMVGKCIDDFLEAYSDIIDILKLSGKQAAMMNEKSLLDFISICKKYDVLVSIGNPVMDVALMGGTKIVHEFIDKCKVFGVDVIEISSIARSIDDNDMCRLIEFINKKEIKVLNEIGIAFAHSEVEDNAIFINRLKKQIENFLNAGSWKILLESEGLTENINKQDYRWDIIDSIISPLHLSEFMVEADDQDVFCKYIEIYGPNINMMIDHTRVLKMEDARIGYGPSQFLWGKVVKY